MARYKYGDDGQMTLVPVRFARQMLPGSFAYALAYRIDHELDLSAVEVRFCHDAVGAPAYSPAARRKIVRLAYSKGLIRSRALEAACRENVLFMAISGESQPHCTTIAQFVSQLGEPMAQLFAQVLVVCDRQGLIGRPMLAIDGVQRPSHASKAKSGTREEFVRQAQKMEAVLSKIVQRHRDHDVTALEPEQGRRAQRQLERLSRPARRIRRWLAEHPEERRGPKGRVRQSHRTDNELAKMATGKGVIQGYTGVAAVDERPQIIVAAQAHGVGQEQALLEPIIEALPSQLRPNTGLSADAGDHSEANLAELGRRRIEAYIPDSGYRQRDARCAAQQRHRDHPDPLYDKTPKPDRPHLFRARDCKPAQDLSHCRCAAGQRLYRNGRHHNLHGFQALKCTGTKRACSDCPLRRQCLRHPEISAVRQVAIFPGHTPGTAESHTAHMQHKIDSERGREMIGRRFATAEPVCGTLRHHKRLHRFTLRGRKNVDGQWKLCGLVHNIEKLTHQGYAR